MKQILRVFPLLLFLVFTGTFLKAQTANFTASATSGCAPLLVQFTSTSTGTITSYKWTFGNSGTSVFANPSTTYTTPGIYTVTLQVTGPGGTSSKSMTITVYDKPTVNFTYTNTAGCAPHTSTFTATATANGPTPVTFYWDFGDGTFQSSSSSTVSHTYTTGSTTPYTVTVIATNGAGCSNTVVKTSIITVYPKPTGTFTATQNAFCSTPATAFFKANVSGTAPIAVAWDYGDGSSPGSGANSSHTYSSTGTYTVTMFLTDAKGCKDSVVMTNYITVTNHASSFTAPLHICQSDSVVLPYPNDITNPFKLNPQNRHASTTYASFTNTTPGAIGSTTWWSFGDGTTDTGMSPKHAYYRPGTDTVRMITDMGGCLDTTYRIITVHAPPKVSATFSFPNCPAPVSIQFTGSGAATYSWYWTGGITATGTTTTRNYTRDGFTDTLIVIGTDAYGCVDTFLTGAPIQDMFAKYSGPIEGCVPLKMDVEFTLGSHVTLDQKYPGFPGIIKSIFWDFGDGNTSTQLNTSNTYTKPGIYQRVVTVTTTNGCVFKDTVEIHVGQHVTPSFTLKPDTVCPKQQVYFTNTTPAPPSAWLKYDWDVGQGYSLVGNRDAITAYNLPGIYDIRLVVDSLGCRDTALCVGCVVVHPSNANFVDSIFCAPQLTTVFFSNTSKSPTSSLWDFGDGQQSTQTSPIHSYTTPGLYWVRLTTHNSTYGCRDTLTQIIDVRGVSIDFSAPDTTLCPGQALTLNPKYTGTDPRTVIRIEWSIDDKAQVHDTAVLPFTYYMVGKAADPYYGIDSPILGYHDVSYRITRRNLTGTCIDTIRKNHYFLVSKPTPKFSGGPIIGCTPLPITFRDSSTYTPGAGPGSLFWKFGTGDTATASGASITYTYQKAGLYPVTLKVTDANGCADSLTKPALVDARHPTADFHVSTTIACGDRPINFANLSQPPGFLNFLWKFGDGDTSNLLHPQHSYHAAGSYTVQLIVVDQTGCRDTLTKTNLITITRPAAGFTMSDSVAVCPPLSVKFTSTAINVKSYDWDFGNTGKAAIPNPSSTYVATGLYAVRQIVSDVNGCLDTAIKNVRVLGYSGALTYTPLKGCAPLQVDFTSSVTNVPSIIWDFSDGTTQAATGATVSHVYMTPGAYVPKLLFSDGPKCKSASEGLDTIKVDAVEAGFKAVGPCIGSPTQFVDTSYSYFSALKDSRWDFGGSGVMTGNPVQRVYTNAGTYPVTLITTNANGCKDTITKDVTIFPLPIVIAPSDTGLCIPDAIKLTASGAKTYVWSPAAGLSCTNCQEPMASPTSAMNYIVTGTDSNGCVNKDTISIRMQTKTTFVTAGDGVICLGQSFQLFAAGATTYNWTPAGSLNNPDIPNPKASPTANTTYIVTGWEGSCLPDTHKIHVIVRPLPNVDAGGDLKVVAGNGVLLQASGTGITRVRWTEDPTLSCFTCYAPEARPKVSTTYYITAYNEFECAATDSVRVEVLCDGSQLFVPNTFTPNGDGKNDFFFPRGQGLDHINAFRVYSRWGELLFERTNMALNDEYSGWNGTFSGRKLNPDVYVYIIEATCDTGEPIRFKGDVTLLR